MIRSVGFPATLTSLHLFRQDAPLKAHPAYRLAKAGDPDAALDLVLDIAANWLGEHGARFASGLCFVAPHAQEATGDNAIPQTLASVCAAMLEGVVDSEVVQSDRVYHTGADPMERMATRAQFEGRVIPGLEYVLVDDVTSLGGTLAELSIFIHIYGGVVRDVLVLVNAGRSPALPPERQFVRLLKERFGNEITELFGIEPAALTANEAQYLVGFQSVDQLRNRLASAEQEIDHRLRSKGIARTFEKTPLGASLDQGLSSTDPLTNEPKDK